MASAVVMRIILFPARIERGKLMRSKTTTVSLEGTAHLPSPKGESITSSRKGNKFIFQFTPPFLVKNKSVPFSFALTNGATLHVDGRVVRACF